MHISIRDKRASHIIISVLLCFLCAGLVKAYFYFSNVEYPEFGLAVFLLLSLGFGAVSGLVAVLLRAFDAIGNTSFLYRFIGTANMILGIAGALILIFGELDAMELMLFVLCWIIGFFVLQDTFSETGRDRTSVY